MSKTIDKIINKIIDTEVDQVVFANEDGSERRAIIVRDCVVGDSLLLRRERDSNNKYDEFAIAVYHKETNQQIGCLNHRINYEVFKHLESGKNVSATITDIQWLSSSSPWVYIEVILKGGSLIKGILLAIFIILVLNVCTS